MAGDFSFLSGSLPLLKPSQKKRYLFLTQPPEATQLGFLLCSLHGGNSTENVKVVGVARSLGAEKRGPKASFDLTAQPCPVGMW